MTPKTQRKKTAPDSKPSPHDEKSASVSFSTSTDWELSTKSRTSGASSANLKRSDTELNWNSFSPVNSMDDVPHRYRAQLPPYPIPGSKELAIPQVIKHLPAQEPLLMWRNHLVLGASHALWRTIRVNIGKRALPLLHPRRPLMDLSTRLSLSIITHYTSIGYLPLDLWSLGIRWIRRITSISDRTRLALTKSGLPRLPSPFVFGTPLSKFCN